MVNDLWLENLNEGACFNVYKCFGLQTRPLVTYVVSSETCKFYTLSLSDVRKVAKTDIPLADSLDLIDLRIKKNLVDDIDIFPYNKSYYERRSNKKDPARD